MIMLFFIMKRCAYLIFGVLIFTLVSCDGSLVVSPMNTAVVAGNRTTLNCSSNRGNSVFWSWLSPNGDTVAYGSSPGSKCVISSTASYASSYDVGTPSTGSSYCNLVILNATSAIAGSYLCSDGTLPVGSAVLLVLDSGPQCSTDAVNNTVVYPGQVTMNCSVQYNSSSGWIPSLQWNTTDSTTSGTSGATAYTSFFHTTQASTPVPSYSCTVKYNDSVSVDIPSCSTNPVSVLWCPSAVTISGASGGYIARNSNLTCSASGNPSPTYQWFNSTNNLLTIGPSLTVSNQDNYTCTASNNANGSRCSTSVSQFVNVTQTTTQNPTTTQKPAETTVTTRSPVTSVSVASPGSVTVNPGPGTGPTPTPVSCSTDCIIGIVVGVGGGFLIIIIIIAVCCCKRKRTCCFKEPKKPKPKKPTSSSTDNLTTTTAEISYNSHQNPTFDSSASPKYDNFHGQPHRNGGSMGAAPVNPPYSYDEDNFDGPPSGNGMGAVPVNSPYSYKHEVPAYSSAYANPHVSQRVNGDPKSLYPNRSNLNYVDDAVQYAQLEMDNKPRSRQPLQVAEIPKETEYEFVKRA